MLYKSNSPNVLLDEFNFELIEEFDTFRAHHLRMQAKCERQDMVWALYAAPERPDLDELGRENVLNTVQRIEVGKFVPDPTRREFGLMFVN